MVNVCMELDCLGLLIVGGCTHATFNASIHVVQFNISLYHPCVIITIFSRGQCLLLYIIIAVRGSSFAL